jgi:hypothetical protein
VCEELKRRYPIHTTTTLICGGGFEQVSRLINEFAPATKIMKDSQFANAIGYYNVGRSQYGRTN